MIEFNIGELIGYCLLLFVAGFGMSAALFVTLFSGKVNDLHTEVDDLTAQNFLFETHNAELKRALRKASAEKEADKLMKGVKKKK